MGNMDAGPPDPGRGLFSRKDGSNLVKHIFCNGNEIMGILGQGPFFMGCNDDPVADELIFQGQGTGIGLWIGRKKGREPRLGTEKRPVVIRKQGNEQFRGLGFQEDPRLDPGGQEALVDGPSQLHGGMGEQEGKPGKTTQIRALLRAVFQHAPGIGIILFQQMVGADHVNMVVEEGRGI